MTIASEIQRIKDNIADAYDAAEAKGATIPVTENSNNLADCINSISYSGEIENKNTNEGATNPLSIWQGAEQEYNQYEMSSWKNWKTDTNVSQNSTVTVPFYSGGHSSCKGAKLLGGKHVTSDNGYIYYSDDGVNWNSHKIDENYNSYYLLEYHNGTYYAFTAVSGTFTRYSSTDLVNWTSDTTDSSNSGSWYDICYVGNRILGWGQGAGMVASDDDGLTWVAITPPEGPYWSDNRGISYVNGIGFYSRNMSNQTALDLWTSTDGVTWTPASAISGTATAGSWKIAYGNGIYVMICATYSGGYSANARTSTDGVNWSDIHSLGNYIIGGSNDRFDARSCDIAFVNGRFLVSGRYNSSIRSSKDGETWQEVACAGFGKTYGFLPVVSNNTAVAYNFNLTSTTPLPSPIILVDKKECYTLDSEPTTETAIYSEPSVESLLTVTSVGVDSITLSDGYTYNRNTSSDTDTYRNVGEVHPDYLCLINNVGIKINNISIASA